MNYTKGELRVANFHGSLFIRDKDNRILAEMHDGSYEEKESNAELFAASPYLYEALKAVIAPEANERIQFEKNLLFASAPELKPMIERALRKAEGK